MVSQKADKANIVQIAAINREDRRTRSTDVEAAIVAKIERAIGSQDSRNAMTAALGKVI